MIETPTEHLHFLGNYFFLNSWCAFPQVIPWILSTWMITLCARTTSASHRASQSVSVTKPLWPKLWKRLIARTIQVRLRAKFKSRRKKRLEKMSKYRDLPVSGADWWDRCICFCRSSCRSRCQSRVSGQCAAHQKSGRVRAFNFSLGSSFVRCMCWFCVVQTSLLQQSFSSVVLKSQRWCIKNALKNCNHICVLLALSTRPSNLTGIVTGANWKMCDKFFFSFDTQNVHRNVFLQRWRNCLSGVSFAWCTCWCGWWVVEKNSYFFAWCFCLTRRHNHLAKSFHVFVWEWVFLKRCWSWWHGEIVG